MVKEFTVDELLCYDICTMAQATGTMDMSNASFQM